MDITKTRLTNQDVTWASFNFGAIDKITIAPKPNLKPIKVGSVGDVILGHRLISLDFELKVEAREISLATLQAIMPWYTSGAIPLMPTVAHTDLYSFADVLTLHPIDQGVTTTQDYNFLKVVPLIEDESADGENDNKLLTGFMVYPDRAQLPALVYGYRGDIPA
jgi:hypothetical protein